MTDESKQNTPKDLVTTESKKGVKIKTHKRSKSAPQESVSTESNKKDKIRTHKKAMNGTEKDSAGTKKDAVSDVAKQAKSDAEKEATADTTQDASSEKNNAVEAETEKRDKPKIKKDVRIESQTDDISEVEKVDTAETEQEVRKRSQFFENPLKTTKGKIILSVIIVLILLSGVIHLKQKAPRIQEKKTVKIHIKKRHKKPMEASFKPKERTTQSDMVAVTEGIPEDNSATKSSKDLSAPVDTTTQTAEPTEPKTPADKKDELPVTNTTAQTLPQESPSESERLSTSKGSQPSEAINEAIPAGTKPSASPTQTQKLLNISIIETGGGPALFIQTEGHIRSFLNFILPNPPRLVIDLKGKWAKPKFYNVKLEHDVFEMVRLWNYENKLRIVCDLKSKVEFKPIFEQTADGLIIQWDKPAS